MYLWSIIHGRQQWLMLAFCFVDNELVKPTMNSSLQTLELLSQQIRDMETVNRPVRAGISSGSRAMDRLLPCGGYACGSMLELVRNQSGSGAFSLALMIAKQAMVNGKYLIVLDPYRQLYPVALPALGIPIERVIALQPNHHADAIWSMDQAFRCSAVGAVIAEVGHLEDRAARRLQLAAEQGGGLGILMRDPVSARNQPSWSDVQWMVRKSTSRFASALSSTQLSSTQDARWFDMELMRCNGGRAGARLTVGIDASGQWIEAPTRNEARHEHASTVHLAAELAKPAHRRHEAAG
jgi:protein ImuA